MKTRENELHQPKESILPSGDVLITCTMCGNQTLIKASSGYAVLDVLTRPFRPNYCPNCGARLKEVDK